MPNQSLKLTQHPTGRRSVKQYHKAITSDPHVDGSGDGKHEQKENKHECFHVVGRNSLDAEQDRPQQFTL